MDMSTANPMKFCRWCGMAHGPSCYMVKAIEFYQDGVTVRRVEFKSAADYPPAAVSSVFQIKDANIKTNVPLR